MNADAARIAILDCGAQYTKVIDRQLRQMNIETGCTEVRSLRF
jgi:GMP synthase-like glutamine amidotransferase